MEDKDILVEAEESTTQRYPSPIYKSEDFNFTDQGGEEYIFFNLAAEEVGLSPKQVERLYFEYGLDTEKHKSPIDGRKRKYTTRTILNQFKNIRDKESEQKRPSKIQKDHNVENIENSLQRLNNFIETIVTQNSTSRKDTFEELKKINDSFNFICEQQKTLLLENKSSNTFENKIDDLNKKMTRLTKPKIFLWIITVFLFSLVVSLLGYFYLNKKYQKRVLELETQTKKYETISNEKMEQINTYKELIHTLKTTKQMLKK